MSKTAFLFPGQGSQYPGMGKELANNFSVVRQTFEEADDALGAGFPGFASKDPRPSFGLPKTPNPRCWRQVLHFYGS